MDSNPVSDTFKITFSKTNHQNLPPSPIKDHQNLPHFLSPVEKLQVPKNLVRIGF